MGTIRVRRGKKGAYGELEREISTKNRYFTHEIAIFESTSSAY